MLEVADVFQRYGGEYLDKYGPKMLPSHQRAISDILNCRTPAMGGHLYACDHCDHRQYSYHSCKNRSCPKCHGGQTEIWLEKRQKELLPVPYYHVVFTIPQELRLYVRSHQTIMYGIMMKAAGQSLIKLAADPHYIGGMTGVMTVLHTWSRTINYHPHVHCLVPGGGITPDHKWREARKGYLVPVRALSKMYSGMVREMVAKELPELQIPGRVWRKKWVVYCKPSVQGVDKVLNYLGRYVHRVAIANSRILLIDNGKVSFRYQNSSDQQWKTMTLDAQEFIRRFLQHVLPRGFHKVRYYGLWNPAHRTTLRSLQIILGPEKSDPLSSMAEPIIEISYEMVVQIGKTCPHCKEGILLHQGIVPRQERVPP